MIGGNFRQAEFRDLKAIISLLVDDPHGAGRENPEQMSLYERAFREIIDCPNSELNVFHSVNGEIMGCIQSTYVRSLSYQGALRCLIEDVRVSLPQQRKGIGSYLLNRAIANAVERNCQIVELFMHRDRDAARNLYLRLGFKQEHDGFRLLL